MALLISVYPVREDMLLKTALGTTGTLIASKQRLLIQALVGPGPGLGLGGSEGGEQVVILKGVLPLRCPTCACMNPGGSTSLSLHSKLLACLSLDPALGGDFSRRHMD